MSTQLGVAKETTYGTGVTPTRFIEFNDETVKRAIERIESTGLRPNRRIVREKQSQPGRESVAGDIDADVNTAGFGLFFEQCLGAVTSSQPNVGSAPTVWEHLAEVGAMDAKSLTTQVARTDSSGSTRAFTYAGCKIPKWELMCDEDGLLKIKMSLDAQSETTATALASASYASTAQPLVYTGAVFNLKGTEKPVKKFTLAGDNGLATDRYAMKATNPQQARAQLEGEKLREYTGKMEMEFEGLSEYEMFTKQEIGSLTAFFTGPIISGTFASAVEVTIPGVRLDGETPNVSGVNIINIPLSYKVVDTEAAKGPVQIKYRTTDTTP